EYTSPNLTTGEGTEVFYRYDEADPDLSAVVAPASSTGSASSTDDAQRCPSSLDNWLGNTASVATLGAKSIKLLDGRGRAVCGAPRLAVPGAPASALGDRYAARWYVKRIDYDAADRIVAASSGARSAELLGADGKSTLRAGYTNRGDDVYSVT